MTKRALGYLRSIGDTPDTSLRLTKDHAKMANELRQLGLVEYIPYSLASIDVCLNNAGMEQYNKLIGPTD